MTVTNGPYSLSARARDAAGNTATSAVRNVTVSNFVDLEPPTAPSNLTATGGITAASLTWTVSTDNVGVVRYNVHRAAVSGFVPSAANRIAQPTSNGYSNTGLAGGTYYYLVTAEDAAGNVSAPSNEASAVVVPDTTPPVVTLTSPAAGAAVSGTIVLTADATDDVAVAGVQFRLDNADLGAEDLTAPYSFSWNTTTVANGTHVLAARARDASGNVLTSATVTVTVSNAAPTGLVLALGFNEGSGTTVADVSGSGNNGTTANTTWSTAGRFGGALSFNGSNSWVAVADAASLDLTTGMTLEAWVSPTSFNGWETVLLKETNGDLVYSLYADNTAARPGVWVRQGGSTYATLGTTQVPLNTWTHVAGTYDGAFLRFYLNGTLATSLARTGSLDVSGNPLRIGGNAVWSEWYNGLIDEVRVYNRALTQGEIQQDMNAPIGGPLQFDGPPALFPQGAVVTEQSIVAVAREAAARWAALGLLPAQEAALDAVTLLIADLPGVLLGLTVGQTIWIDRDAAGYGWFIDPTPEDDSEFPASTASPAFGKVDLLTVLAHEMGHTLGLEHSAEPEHVMEAALPLGVRWLPDLPLIEEPTVFAPAVDPQLALLLAFEASGRVAAVPLVAASSDHATRTVGAPLDLPAAIITGRPKTSTTGDRGVAFLKTQPEDAGVIILRGAKDDDDLSPSLE